MNEAAFRTAFKDAMAHLWPNGVSDRRQVRDVIRIYAMGVVDALMALDKLDAVDACVQWMETIVDEQWMPDDSWNWWHDVTRN